MAKLNYDNVENSCALYYFFFSEFFDEQEVQKNLLKHKSFVTL